MSVVKSINPDLLNRAEAYARAHAVSVDTVIEHALADYLGTEAKATLTAPRAAGLPVAVKLQMVSQESCGMSYGKLIAQLDDGLSLDSAR